MTTILSGKHALQKHRLASGPAYEVDFGRSQLPAGVTLSSPSVKVFTEGVGPDSDVTSQFGPTSLSVVTGTKSQKAAAAVQFVLSAAAGGAQDAGGYVLRVEATGSDGLKYESVHWLTVYEEGDSSAS